MCVYIIIQYTMYNPDPTAEEVNKKLEARPEDEDASTSSDGFPHMQVEMNSAKLITVTVDLHESVNTAIADARKLLNALNIPSEYSKFSDRIVLDKDNLKVQVQGNIVILLLFFK